MVAELHHRKQHWSNVRYRDPRERFAESLVIQTFTISGIDEHDTPFDVAAVDLYSVDSGLITKKDTYWKHEAPAR